MLVFLKKKRAGPASWPQQVRRIVRAASFSPAYQLRPDRNPCCNQPRPRETSGRLPVALMAAAFLLHTAWELLGGHSFSLSEHALVQLIQSHFFIPAGRSCAALKNALSTDSREVGNKNGSCTYLSSARTPKIKTTTQRGAGSNPCNITLENKSDLKGEVLIATFTVGGEGAGECGSLDRLDCFATKGNLVRKQVQGSTQVKKPTRPEPRLLVQRCCVKEHLQRKNGGQEAKDLGSALIRSARVT